MDRERDAGRGETAKAETAKKFRDELVSLDGDHLTMLRAYDAYEDAHRGGDAANWCRDLGIDQLALDSPSFKHPPTGVLFFFFFFFF